MLRKRQWYDYTQFDIDRYKSYPSIFKPYKFQIDDSELFEEWSNLAQVQADNYDKHNKSDRSIYTKKVEKTQKEYYSIFNEYAKSVVSREWVTFWHELCFSRTPHQSMAETIIYGKKTSLHAYDLEKAKACIRFISRMCLQD